MQDSPISFERLVVVSNPRSSNADRAARITARLEKAFPGKVITRTIGATEGENVKLLKDTLQTGDILLVCGGDGTIGNMIAGLLDSQIPAKLRKTPVIPVGTGRMNDFARIVNGRFYANPLYVLRHGRPISVHPLVCTCEPLDPNNKPMTRIAIYNVGFGFSGEGSLILNDPEFRADPQLRTAITRPTRFAAKGWELLQKIETFNITLHGRQREALDITATNGHIFYGYGRVPINLSRREFYLTLFDDKRPLSTALTVGQMITKRHLEGEIVASAEFILHDPVVGHVGGEPFTPPVPCRVTIKPHQEAVTLLTASSRI